MILRIEKCEVCGENVTVQMPSLFPDFNSNKLSMYKKLETAKASYFCKNCKLKQEEK